MNISHFRIILFNLKIFGEVVTTETKFDPLKVFDTLNQFQLSKCNWS